MACSRQTESAHSSTNPTKAKVSSRRTARFTLGVSGGHGGPQLMQTRPEDLWPVIIVTAVPRICASKLEKWLWHFFPKKLYAERARPLLLKGNVLSTSIIGRSAWRQRRHSLSESGLCVPWLLGISMGQIMTIGQGCAGCACSQGVRDYSHRSVRGYG